MSAEVEFGSPDEPADVYRQHEGGHHEGPDRQEIQERGEKIPGYCFWVEAEPLQSAGKVVSGEDEGPGGQGRCVKAVNGVDDRGGRPGRQVSRELFADEDCSRENPKPRKQQDARHIDGHIVSADGRIDKRISAPGGLQEPNSEQYQAHQANQQRGVHQLGDLFGYLDNGPHSIFSACRRAGRNYPVNKPFAKVLLLKQDLKTKSSSITVLFRLAVVRSIAERGPLFKENREWTYFGLKDLCGFRAR